MTIVQLTAIAVPGDIDAWVALGFRESDGDLALRNGAVRPGADTPTLVVERVGNQHQVRDIEGVPLVDGAPVAPGEHPNSALDIDHLVLMTDSLDRTSAAVESALGLPQRRIRETPSVRQAFHRFPDRDGARGCIIELVERADATTTSLWGLVVNVADLDVFCERAGDLVGAPKSAVQPGRRIATVRREAGLGVAVALMSPE